MSYSILIVDDEVLIRKILSEILAREGFEVFAADCGEQALEFLEKKAVDFILLDIKMPGIDGMEVLRRLQPKLSNTIVIMISGHGNYQHAVEAVKAGAFDFIEKPFSIPALLSALEKGRRRKSVLTAYSRYFDTRDLGYLSGSEMEKTLRKAAGSGAHILIRGKPGTGKSFFAGRLLELGGIEKSRIVRIDSSEAEMDIELEKSCRDKDVAGILIDSAEKLSRKQIQVLQSFHGRIAGTTEQVDAKPSLLFADVVDLPSLADIPNRVEIFLYLLEHYCRQQGSGLKLVADEALKLVEDNDWTGNFRQMQRVCRELVGAAGAGIILAADLKNIFFRSETVPLEQYMEEFRESYTMNTISSLNWDLERAASVLDIPRQQVTDFLEGYYNRLRAQSGTYSLVLESDFDEIRRAQDFVVELLEKRGMSDNRMCEIKLLIDELVANAIEHGYEDTKGQIFFSVIIREGKIQFVVSDEGKGFTFRRTELPKDVFSMGGRGLFMAESLGDEFKLDSAPGKGTEIISGKRIDDYLILAVGADLRRLFLQEFQNAGTVFFSQTSELQGDYQNSGILLLHETQVMELPEKITTLRAMYPRFSVVVCGTKTTISQSAEYAFFGAEDFWPQELVQAKLEVLLSTWVQEQGKIKDFGVLAEFHTVSHAMLMVRKRLLGHSGPGHFVFRGQTGTGREQMVEFLAVRTPLLVLSKVDFRSNPHAFLRHLEERGRMIYVTNFTAISNRMREQLREALAGSSACGNVVIFALDEGQEIPDFIEDMLSVETLEFLPLCRRREDISHLACIFAERACSQDGIRQKNFSLEALALLQTHQWPGNCDELLEVVCRCVKGTSGRVIESEIVHDMLKLQYPATGQILRDVMDLAEKNYLDRLVRQHSDKAAAMSGLSRKAFQELLVKHGLQV
ncbi:MAG: response regulator [Candidatus Wallbacteria bacterium]|nr:response regulator [Candidatus Wallbacteria bacterium]